MTGTNSAMVTPDIIISIMEKMNVNVEDLNGFANAVCELGVAFHGYRFSTLHEIRSHVLKAFKKAEELARKYSENNAQFTKAFVVAFWMANDSFAKRLYFRQLNMGSYEVFYHKYIQDTCRLAANIAQVSVNNPLQVNMYALRAVDMHCRKYMK